MSSLVYILCALTSLVCAICLYRGYRATPNRLLFWAAICFGGLALNNVVLVVDILVLPEIDLSMLRTTISCASLSLLLYGLIWEAV